MFACTTVCDDRVCGAPAALSSLSPALSLDRRNMKWKLSFLLTGCRRRLRQRSGPVHKFLDGPSGLVDPVSEARVDLAHAESAAALLLLCCSLKTQARRWPRPWIVLIMRPARRRSSHFHSRPSAFGHWCTPEARYILETHSYLCALCIAAWSGHVQRQ